MGKTIEQQNRGRIQAQGNGCEESESWNQRVVPTKVEGHKYLSSLQSNLSKKQLKERKQSFCKAKRFIDNAPNSGHNSVKLSYTPYPPNKDVRVDIEIIKGKAFRNDY